jgi:hypothetical protein
LNIERIKIVRDHDISENDNSLSYCLPLNIERDGRFVAEIFDETLAGLADEESETNCQQNEKRYFAFLQPDPVKLKSFSSLF